MKDIAALRKLAGCAIAYPKSSTAQDNYYLAIRPVDFILLLDRLDAAEKVGTTGIKMLHFINNPYAAPEVVHNAIIDFQQAVKKWQEAQ